VAKHGLEALSDTLRMELRPWGIRVCVVQPGAVATPMPEKLLREVAQVGAALPAPAREHYGGTFLRYARALADNNIRSGDSPESVARAVLAAVTDATPRTRYVVGVRTGVLLVVSRLLPDRLQDRVTLRFLDRYRPAG
jgi:NAD(P)-dependent dehydrogenase (short-subunit alcohol dehydrogenase family)